VDIGPDTMRCRVRNGRWPRLQSGVYAAFSEEPIREAVLWATCSAPVRVQRTGNRYLDNLYEEYGVCVELDGTAAHSADERWRGKRRDNANAVRGIVTLRFGLPELGDRRCEAAVEVAAVLRLHAWPGSPIPAPAQPAPFGRNFMIVNSIGWAI